MNRCDQYESECARHASRVNGGTVVWMLTGLLVCSATFAQTESNLSAVEASGPFYDSDRDLWLEDSDSDGFPNLTEEIAGSNPFDETSLPDSAELDSTELAEPTRRRRSTELPEPPRRRRPTELPKPPRRRQSTEPTWRPTGSRGLGRVPWHSPARQAW